MPTTTIATVATDVTNRLNIGSTSAEPGAAQLALWVITEATHFLGALQPPVETTTTVSTSTFSCTLVADRVYFVARGSRMLFRGADWEKQGSTIQFTPGAVTKGDTVQIWYFLDPDLTSASTTVNLDCIFGTQWGIEPITLMTMMQVESRMKSVNPAGDGPDFLQAYMVFQKEREMLYAPFYRVKDQWMQEMGGSLAARAQFGDVPRKESPASGLTNRSRIVNRLTGVP